MPFMTEKFEGVVMKVVLFTGLIGLAISGGAQAGYDPLSGEDTYHVISKIEVQLPNGDKQFATLKVEGQLATVGRKSAELYSPYIEVEDAHGETVTYPFQATQEVKNVICLVANGPHVPAREQADPAPVTVLNKPLPIQAVSYGPQGFVVISGVTSIAANVPCLVTQKSYSNLTRKLATIEVIRKSDGSVLIGEVRAVATVNNPAGLPWQVYMPQVFIGGTAYDIYGGQSHATSSALCKILGMGVKGQVGGRASADAQDIVVHKEGHFYLYERTPAPTLVSFLTCGYTGGDGSN
jgi:hypothetical protein